MTTNTKHIKLSKAQISKIIQFGEYFGSWLGNLRQKSLRTAAITLARDNLPELVSDLAPNAIKKFEITISWKGSVRAGKLFTVLISIEYKNDVIKTIKSLEDSNVLFNGVTGTVKQEIK